MLRRVHRFSGRKALQYVYRVGKTVYGKGIGLRFAPNTATYRVAVVVSKKVHKSAVVRNRIRRRVYEVIRTVCTPLDCGDYVFQVFELSVLTMEHVELKTAIQKLLEKTVR